MESDGSLEDLGALERELFENVPEEIEHRRNRVEQETLFCLINVHDEDRDREIPCESQI